MKPREVAKLLKCKVRNVQLWAAANGVEYTGEGYRKDYNFTEDDIERFRNRKITPGPERGEK